MAKNKRKIIRDMFFETYYKGVQNEECNLDFYYVNMTKEELKKEIDNTVFPKGWRKGQRVFNYIDDVYGIARRIQFEKHVDCFHNDDAIDAFLDAAADIINQG